MRKGTGALEASRTYGIAPATLGTGYGDRRQDLEAGTCTLRRRRGKEVQR